MVMREKLQYRILSAIAHCKRQQGEYFHSLITFNYRDDDRVCNWSFLEKMDHKRVALIGIAGKVPLWWDMGCNFEISLNKVAGI